MLLKLEEYVKLVQSSQKATGISPIRYTFFYKQLDSGLIPQSWLYFQDFGAQRFLMVAK